MTRDEIVRLDRVVENLSKLIGRIDEQEKTRKELREIDEARWSDVFDRLHSVDDALARVPGVVDAKIAACRSDRTYVTGAAVSLASDLRGFGTVVLKVGALAGTVTGVVLGVGKVFGWY